MNETDRPTENVTSRSTQQLLQASQQLLQAQHVTEETAQKLMTLLENSAPVRHLRGSQIASALLGSVGFALFIVGVERAAADIPIVSNAYGSIIIGIILLFVTGLLLRKLAGHE